MSKDSPLGLQVMTSSMSCIDNFNFKLVKSLAEILGTSEGIYNKWDNSSIFPHTWMKQVVTRAGRMCPGSPTIVREFLSHSTCWEVFLFYKPSKGLWSWGELRWKKTNNWPHCNHNAFPIPCLYTKDDPSLCDTCIFPKLSSAQLMCQPVV